MVWQAYRAPALFFVIGHVCHCSAIFSACSLITEMAGPLGELLGLSGLNSVFLGLACRQSSLRPFVGPNHARQVGATRALVAISPSSFLRGGTLVTSRSVFLHRGHAKLPCLLGASATFRTLVLRER